MNKLSTYEKGFVDACKRREERFYLSLIGKLADAIEKKQRQLYLTVTERSYLNAGERFACRLMSNLMETVGETITINKQAE